MRLRGRNEDCQMFARRPAVLRLEARVSASDARHSGAPMLRRYSATLGAAYLSAVAPWLQRRE